MEGQVQQVVTPRVQAVHGVVEAEGEDAEGPKGLVAAAVRQQGAPEVVVQDVGPRRLREKILVGLDGATAKHKTNNETLAARWYHTPGVATSLLIRPIIKGKHTQRSCKLNRLQQTRVATGTDVMNGGWEASATTRGG